MADRLEHIRRAVPVLDIGAMNQRANQQAKGSGGADEDQRLAGPVRRQQSVPILIFLPHHTRLLGIGGGAAHQRHGRIDGIEGNPLRFVSGIIGVPGKMVVRRTGLSRGGDRRRCQ